MSTGARIRDRRKQLGLSADDLAEKIGVARSTMFRYENGDIEKVPLDYLGPLSAALDTTPEYLMGWSSDPEPKENIEADEPQKLTDFEFAVLKQLRLLSEDQQRKFLALLTSLISTQEP